MTLQKFIVLSSAARYVENRVRSGRSYRDHGAQNLAFVRVVLEMIDGVVELGTFQEHRASLAISCRGFTRASCAKNHAGMEARDKTVRLDLRGVKCPLNWARAKVRLEQMSRAEVLQQT